MSLVKLICKSFVFAFILGFTHVSIAQAADAASVGFGTGIMLSVVYGLISIILLTSTYLPTLTEEHQKLLLVMEMAILTLMKLLTKQN